MTFGQRLRKARKEKKLTQIELANLLNVSNSSISDWENDKNRPNIELVEFLCGVLEVTPSFLMGVKSEEKQPLSGDDARLLKDYHRLPEKKQQVVRDLISSFLADLDS